MPEPWTGEIVGQLHVNRITQRELAKKAGYSEEYVSMLLNGAKSSTVAEDVLRTALEEIINSK